MMRAIQLAVACVAVLVATAGRSEAGIITFEAYAQAGAGADLYASPFDVDGYRFTGNLVVNDYIIFQTGSVHFSGSTALLPFSNETHTFRRIDGAAFSLNSFDYSEPQLAPLSPARTVTFTGNFVGGGTIIQAVTSDGVIGSQNAVFTGFSNLSSVVFEYETGSDSGFQLDNINVTSAAAAIPDPSTIVMFGIGAGVMGLVSIRRRRREQKQAATG